MGCLQWQGRGIIRVNNVGEDNRRHSSVCRSHTWEGCVTELGFKTISID